MCSKGTSILMTQLASAPSAANSFLKGAMLQIVTMTVRIRKGDHALAIWPAV